MSAHPNGEASFGGCGGQGQGLGTDAWYDNAFIYWVYDNIVMDHSTLSQAVSSIIHMMYICINSNGVVMHRDLLCCLYVILYSMFFDFVCIPVCCKCSGMIIQYYIIQLYIHTTYV